jgi:exodeoxyribonuclease VII small subunit
VSKPKAGESTAAGESNAAEEPNYEQARAELAEIVRALESGGQSLEESLALWERGEELADRCQAWLDGAKATIEAAVARRSAAPD